MPWIEELLQLKLLVENETREHFNSCLLNLYHNGNETMAWHSDGEKDLKKNGAIASLSLGAWQPSRDEQYNANVLAALFTTDETN